MLGCFAVDEGAAVLTSTAALARSNSSSRDWCLDSRALPHRCSLFRACHVHTFEIMLYTCAQAGQCFYKHARARTEFKARGAGSVRGSAAVLGQDLDKSPDMLVKASTPSLVCQSLVPPPSNKTSVHPNMHDGVSATN